MKDGKSSARRSRSPTITDARMVRTREALRRALLALIERKQFEQITIRDIAAEAGIGYATFFRHHSSKTDLLNEIAAEEIGLLMVSVFPLLDPKDTRVSCLALCNYIDKQRALWSVLLTGGAAGTLREEFVRQATQGAPKVRTSEWLPVELGAVYGASAAVEILAWWLRRPDDEYTAEQIAEILDRLVVAPAFSEVSGSASAIVDFENNSTNQSAGRRSGG
jgi:AcrR family transcriptional regulator